MDAIAPQDAEPEGDLALPEMPSAKGTWPFLPGISKSLSASVRRARAGHGRQRPIPALVQSRVQLVVLFEQKASELLKVHLTIVVRIQLLNERVDANVDLERVHQFPGVQRGPPSHQS